MGIRRPRLAPVLALALAAVMALAAPAARAAPVGDATVDYTADIVIESEGTVLSGRIHHRAGRKGGPGIDRFELAGGPRTVTLVVRPDRRAAWILLARQKAYAVYDLANARAMVGVMDDRLLKLTHEGNETIEGIETQRYGYSGKDRRGNRIGGKVWLTESQIVMRMQGFEDSPQRGRRQMVMQLRNVKFVTPAPAHFRIPRGWREIRLQ